MTQCGNLAIFLPIRFYVKPISVSLDSQNSDLENFCIQSELKLTKNQSSSEPINISLCQILRLYILLKLISRKNEWQKNPKISTLCTISTCVLCSTYVHTNCDVIASRILRGGASHTRSKFVFVKTVFTHHTSVAMKFVST